MHIVVTSTTTSVDGPDLTIDCPACAARGATATTTLVTEKNALFGVIPFLSSRSVVVTCGQCAKQFGTGLTAETLQEMAPEALGTHLAARVGSMAKFCVLMGMLFFIPVVGFVFALLGTLLTSRKRSGWRTVAYVGLVLSTIFSLVFVLGILFGGSSAAG